MTQLEILDFSEEVFFTLEINGYFYVQHEIFLLYLGKF